MWSDGGGGVGVVDGASVDTPTMDVHELRAVIMQNADAAEMYLDNRSLDDTHAVVIAEALRFDSARWHTLVLNRNYIGASGAAALATALADNTTLTLLALNDNELDVTAARALGGMLRVNRTLRTLQLSNNKEIGELGGILLVDALLDAVESSGISVLYLRATEIGERTVRRLATLFTQPRRRVALNVVALDENHSIGDRGATTLAHALSHHTSDDASDAVVSRVSYISVEDCNVVHDGAIALLRAWRGNSALGVVSLDRNELSEHAATSYRRACAFKQCQSVV